jgi:hypothetical protein
MDSLWGSKTTTDKGNKLEDSISQEGLCIFNDGTDTYLHPGNGSYSAIELTVTDPFLLIRLKVFDLPYITASCKQLLLLQGFYEKREALSTLSNGCRMSYYQQSIHCRTCIEI